MLFEYRPHGKVVGGIAAAGSRHPSYLHHAATAPQSAAPQPYRHGRTLGIRRIETGQPRHDLDGALPVLYRKTLVKIAVGIGRRDTPDHYQIILYRPSTAVVKLSQRRHAAVGTRQRRLDIGRRCRVVTTGTEHESRRQQYAGYCFFSIHESFNPRKYRMPSRPIVEIDCLAVALTLGLA